MTDNEFLDEDQIDEAQEENAIEDEGDDGSDEADDREEDSGGGQGKEASEEGETLQNRGVGRAERTVLRHKEEMRRAREEAATLRRELDSMRTVQQAQYSKAEEERRRQELEYMSPEERREREHSDRLGSLESQIQRLRFENWDSSDKSSFSQLTSTDKSAARLAKQVEKGIQEERSRGSTIGRKEYYYYLLGREVHEKRDAVIAKEKKAGASRIQRQSTKPSNSQSNVSSTKKEQGYRERLEGAVF